MALDLLYSPDSFDIESVLAYQDKAFGNSPCNSIYKNTYPPSHSDSSTSHSFMTNSLKRRRRRADQVNRVYTCGHILGPGITCTKSYEKISHLNTHRTKKNHGEKVGKNDFLIEY
eukprot:NODE_290_length_10614_cov_1.553590.p12 type:complete len:115 gc:universal NODE_290_length_10614_cov_1.553590:3103-3447(+)